MVSISYPFRLILDYDFMKWILTESSDKTKIITALLHIHNSSKENKKKQNIMLKSDLDRLSAEGLIKDKDLIRGCLATSDFSPEFQKIIKEEEFNEIIQRGILAIELADDPPFKTTIITMQNKLEEYEKEKFFEKLKDVNFKGDREGVYLINSLFKKYCNEKEFCRI
jgi:hypothetical protein